MAVPISVGVPKDFTKPFYQPESLVKIQLLQLNPLNVGYVQSWCNKLENVIEFNCTVLGLQKLVFDHAHQFKIDKDKTNSHNKLVLQC